MRALSNGEDTHHLDSVSWGALVSQISIDCKQERPWHLSGWDELWSLLKLNDLLINIFAFVGIHLVRVESAVLLISSWSSLPVADGWSNTSGESERNLHDLLMTTIIALEDSFSSPD